MSHPRWPGFDTKTGNPIHDNTSRRLNQRIYRDVKRRFKVKAAGRRRKKQLMRVEGGNYIRIVLNVMNDMTREARRDA